ncbi:MAG: TRC40/GET3/ArsA family transport-energizing ATPase [Chloroflexota bacterium]|nr:TRC40/GET3/ArsA family transport-energizing ATPase [Chloroflexota bacterium]
MRVILCTGKGGVGKTSIAAATALKASKLGYKTLILSTDTAHSLSDSFDVSLSGEPKCLANYLWGQETNISHTLRTYWTTIQEWLAALLAWRGVDEIVADEVAVFPGMEELANLLYITQYNDSGEYDVIVIDCAPTGETLRLLSFPEIFRWWMKRLFPTGRAVAHLVRPMAKLASNMPLPSDDVFNSAEHLFQELNKTQELLSDPKTTSVRLVVNPEKMVIKEAQRMLTYLSLYGYSIDLIICNRLIPSEIKDPYFDYWKKNQNEHYSLIKECFAPIPILDLPLLKQEIVGMNMLDLMGTVLYEDNDPSRFFFCGQVQRIESDNGDYILSLALPFISKEDIESMRNDDELTVQVGGFRRNIVLPHILEGSDIIEAKLRDGRLNIKFATRQGVK